MIASPVLVTGGAGFIGSHLVEALLARGATVRVLDSLEPQVHGPGATRARYLPAGVEFFHASVCDAAAVDRALAGVRSVVHLAAQVGVGQSMYAIVPYVDENVRGTAVLLDRLANGGHAVRRLVVASSMSIYGEGRYRCPACGPVAPKPRPLAQLEARDWEVHCPACGTTTTPAPCDEDKPIVPTSVYAVTKRDQEDLCLCVGRAYGIGTVALRLFNVYGPRQALGNPYTGVGAIFSSRLLNGQRPLVFEDGRQSRDFIHVSDIVEAFCLAVERDDVSDVALNVGTGRSTSIAALAEAIARSLGVAIVPDIVSRFREGDIRHCVADVSRIRRVLGFSARMALEKGVEDLVAWARQQEADDRVAQARAELEKKGLIR
ncbi:MAG TPA: NAD-dependent epimerase/dehydratase family protein [Methylomirabilota bacterium]|jgi:dTDP-L-rhamnose 4-epimerase|nr:NAD-dependent epimerase/dehydratase family protein [Methylomirabilota bacterium]